MRTYNECIIEISNCINTEYGKDTQKFKEVLNELREFYKIEISTRFLKLLLRGAMTKREQTIFIRNFLKGADLTTEKRIRFFSEFGGKSYEEDILTYAVGKDGKVFIRDCHSETIGNFFKELSQEVLYFIKGF
jgi:hypothetical protein